MQRRYVTADVFTHRRFEGNPVAVVLNAEGLSAAQMQAVASEFGYSETTFVLPARSAGNTAWVRIFTPSREVPFAGHPNIGTAFVLAGEALAAGKPLPESLRFEEAAGLVPVRQLRTGDTTTGAELITPEPLSRLSGVSVENAARCLSLDPADIRTDAHAPQVVSVGLRVLAVELTSRDALRRCMPNPVGFKAALPVDGAFSVYAYTRDIGTDQGTDLQARMFTGRMTEDPATGSATAAVVALIAEIEAKDYLSITVGQGFDMGRPSLLLTTIEKVEGKESAEIRIGGQCVRAMEGQFFLEGDDAR